jgi:O-acetyl-ADP-ribose deacetylase (regulator of RNase III)
VGSLNLIHGDLFATEHRLIAHGCNDAGAFGSGVAAQISRRFPEARRQYLEKFDLEGWKLGEIQVVPCGAKWIANMATQHGYGRDGLKYVDYDAVGSCLEKVARACVKAGFKGFALPKVGCGLGGGLWSEIEPIVRVVAEEFDLELDLYYL